MLPRVWKGDGIAVGRDAIAVPVLLSNRCTICRLMYPRWAGVRSDFLWQLLRGARRPRRFSPGESSVTAASSTVVTLRNRRIRGLSMWRSQSRVVRSAGQELEELLLDQPMTTLQLKSSRVCSCWRSVAARTALPAR